MCAATVLTLHSANSPNESMFSPCWATTAWNLSGCHSEPMEQNPSDTILKKFLLANSRIFDWTFRKMGEKTPPKINIYSTIAWLASVMSITERTRSIESLSILCKSPMFGNLILLIDICVLFFCLTFLIEYAFVAAVRSIDRSTATHSIHLSV